MAELDLTPIDVRQLDIFENPCDLRRDLHVFVGYVEEREVKRLHRTNRLSKADAMRLAKMMSDPQAMDEVKETGDSVWVDYVDWVALKLGFVSYDTKGVYAGYTSAEPSFPDNYIRFNAQKYEAFLDSSLAEQERRLLDTLLAERDGCRSEFFHTGVLSRLEGFSSFGCATGVVPMLDFPGIRRFLLEELQRCQVGVWYSTASLIQHLKAAHPYFLIPKNPRYKSKWDSDKGRYGNFKEGTDRWNPQIDISEGEPDAFERVEGRYVERFLESAPLVLGYVGVAYDNRPHRELYPSAGYLQAFRVGSRLAHALQGDIPAPRVTIQPNFEIYVESEFYPAAVLSALYPLAEVVAGDVTTILRLDKTRVAAHLAEHEDLDVAALLTRLSGQELPRNIARELAEWSEHAEKFTLYQGYALLESDEDLAIAEPFTVERISPTLRVVHSPGKLFDQLENAELVPLRIEHGRSALHPVPQGARTAFPKKREVTGREPRAKEPVTVRRSTVVTLHFSITEPLEALRQALVEARCPAEVDKSNLTVTFAQQYESQVMEVIKGLETNYVIHIEDIL
jgi:hypothetical protein